MNLIGGGGNKEVTTYWGSRGQSLPTSTNSNSFLNMCSLECVNWGGGRAKDVNE